SWRATNVAPPCPPGHAPRRPDGVPDDTNRSRRTAKSCPPARLTAVLPVASTPTSGKTSAAVAPAPRLLSKAANATATRFPEDRMRLSSIGLLAAHVALVMFVWEDPWTPTPPRAPGVRAASR